MRIINKVPSQRILRNGARFFVYNFFRIIMIGLLFPFAIVWSKKYQKLFFEFCQTYQRDGKILTNNQEIDFNSFDLYHLDLIDRGLENNQFNFTLEQETKMEVVNITNRKGEKISALILENPQSNKWVIGLHGWTENKYLTLRQVSYFYQQGYNILTFDSNAHGLSYGNVSDIGYTNADNLADIIARLKSRYKISGIGLIGNSMGASCETLYAIKYGYKEPLLKWIVSDCGFSSLELQFHYVMKYRYEKPWWLISLGLRKKTQQLLGLNLKEYDLTNNIERIKSVPFLIFHGMQDTFVPIFQSKRFFRAKNAVETKKISEFIEIPDVDHCQTISKRNELYIQSIKLFITKHEL